MSQSNPCVIGQNIIIKGRLSGEEEVRVYGRIEGQILLNNHLIVEASGRVDVEAEAKQITFHGEGKGSFIAAESITLESGANLSGDLRAPRIIIHDGAIFKGNIDMDVDIPDELLK